MSDIQTAPQRCAIYTRQSVESIEREVGSIQTQREVCSAYIRCNEHRGWIEVDTRYDDEGYSAADLERPALQRLFQELAAGRIDVIVFYKIDRFTRSLKDFVRVFDTLDSRGVSLVSVTQSFDTTTSLGRLTLNILLTFAQFEREILSDRIKDSLHALRIRGLPGGAQPPIGYDKKDGRYVVNRREAEIVRDCFRLYPQMKNIHQLAKHLQAAGVLGKRQVSKTGSRRGGKLICSAIVYRMLRNPVYIGQFEHDGRHYEGQHEPIISKAEWNAVQTIMNERRTWRMPKNPDRDILFGLLYDEFGRKLIVERPLDQRRVKHRYYASTPMEKTRSRPRVCPVRVHADRAEQFMLVTICAFLKDTHRVGTALLESGASRPDVEVLLAKSPLAARRVEQMSRPRLRAVYDALLAHVEICDMEVRIFVDCNELRRLLTWDGVGEFNRFLQARSSREYFLKVPAQLAKPYLRWRLPISPGREPNSRPNRKLVNLLKRAFAAKEQLLQMRDQTLDHLAATKGMSVNYFSRLLRLNYLAPDIQTAILDGTQPAGLTLQGLLYSALPLDWTLQREILGFADPSAQSGI